MTNLKEQIRADLTVAMKARNREVTGTLRMVLTAISAEEVSGKSARELSDDEVIAVLIRERKQRLEAAVAFAEGDRPEQAKTEEAEAELISGYLPSALSDQELDELIATAVVNAETVGLSGGRAMGAVMKDLKPATSGRVDGGRLAGLVKKSLGMG
jgi:uncharacterized protein YqeY